MVIKVPIEVRYSETDQMGVVHHSNYLVWFELGRMHFFKAAGFDLAEYEENGIIFPVLKVSVEYLKAVRYGDDDIFVKTYLKEITPLKTIFVQEVIVYNNVAAKAEITLVTVDKKSFKLIRYDQSVIEIYEKFKTTLTKEWNLLKIKLNIFGELKELDF